MCKDSEPVNNPETIAMARVMTRAASCIRACVPALRTSVGVAPVESSKRSPKTAGRLKATKDDKHNTGGSTKLSPKTDGRLKVTKDGGNLIDK